MQGSINFDGTLSGSIAGGGGGGTTPVISADATVDNTSSQSPTCTVSRTGTDETPTFHFAFHGIKGNTGETGQTGPAGADGNDGISPEVSISSITGGTEVTITDADHPTGQSFDVMNGTNGTNGQDGTDGYSPEVTISTISGGHTVNITDKTHPSGQSFNVMDGATGATGPAGQDGITPDISASATIDANTGTPAVSVVKSGTTAAPSFAFNFTNIKGETGQTGQTGETGPAGPGVASGGSTGNVLRKNSSTNYDTYWDELTASEIPYDNTSSGMTATDVQAAVTELKSNLTDLDNYLYKTSSNTYMVRFVVSSKVGTSSTNAYYGFVDLPSIIIPILQQKTVAIDSIKTTGGSTEQKTIFSVAVENSGLAFATTVADMSGRPMTAWLTIS